LICLAAVLLRHDDMVSARAAGRAWLRPAGLAAILIAPWFVYQTMATRGEVWRIMLGQHIYARFTSGLDDSHLHPWHFYASTLWLDLQRAGWHWFAAAGAVALVVAACRRDGWLPRLFLFWGTVPIALVSLGASKLPHYIYPFQPPAALAVGYVVALVVDAAAQAATERLFPTLRRLARTSDRSTHRALRTSRTVLTFAAGLALMTGVLTVMRGRVLLEVHGLEIIRNTSLLRPFLIAGGMLCCAGEVAWSARVLALIPLLAMSPIDEYANMSRRALAVDRPLRATRDCMIDVRRSHPRAGEMVYNAAPALTYHTYNYYLRAFEPWVRRRRADPAELRRRLQEPERQSALLVSDADFFRVAAPIANTRRASGHELTLLGFRADPGLIVLLPGPYAPCAVLAAQSGGELVGLAPGEASP
jgi:hypothetical protein